MYDDTRDLHSFPTRRSSDLVTAIGSMLLRSAAPATFSAMSAPTTSTLRTAAKRKGRSNIRSEEHTSELQSRQYLVCRLLLEKKKIKKKLSCNSNNQSV